ncbi:MAG: hypothetical protein Q4C96_07625 [Planctomycetia bacterium]|nr:hypothetical protein [Planctomycetia bacterium]
MKNICFGGSTKKIFNVTPRNIDLCSDKQSSDETLKINESRKIQDVYDNDKFLGIFMPDTL